MSVELKAIVFVAASGAIAWVSRSSLRNYRSHGFYRFFAWEAIVVLVLLNLDYWFRAPFSMRQMISWLALIVSLFLVIQGFRLLRLVGRPDSRRDDPSLISVEKTTQLVTVGVYRYIRHPLYSSLLFLAWGVFFKHPSWVGACLAVLTTLLLSITARIEEAENIAFFGAAYRDYMKQTKLFIPFIF